MVEADIAFNFDPQSHTNQPDANKQSHSALPCPDNGWRVWGVKSNETGREQQLSVCGNGWRGEGEGGSQDTSVLVKARARERAAVTATTSPKLLPNKAQEKETAAMFLNSQLSEHELLPSLISGWLE